MAEPPPRPPDDDDETVIRDEWAVAPERTVPQRAVVERTEEVSPLRRAPTLWPWLLALLVLVLAGLGALYFLSRDDDEAASTTTSATTTAAQLVSVPDVVGSDLDVAAATIRDAGLDANVVLVPSDAPSGQVVAQDPAAGDEAEEGSTVRLNVAQEAEETTTVPAATTPPPATTDPPATTAPPEPQPATVPDVVGNELADAARAFGNEGLKVAVRYVPSSEAQGRVVAQAQPAGTERRRGDTVQLNVSEGAEPAADASVPGVVGQRQDEARRALEEAGYGVLAINLEDEVRREDRVGSQTPGGGAAVPSGSLVLLYLTS